MKLAAINEELDRVRGVLFARANVGEEFLVPVTSIALHHALAARNAATVVTTILEKLERLRDVQGLSRGHWLPVPTRAVLVGECALVVSGTPSAFLSADHGLELFGNGLGRLTDLKCAKSLPNESLYTWLSSPRSTALWSEEIIRSAKWGNPFGWRDLGVFDHWSRRPVRRWLSPGSGRIPNGVVAARAEHATGQRDHYLLKFRHGMADQLAEVHSADEAFRLRLGLLARAGNPVDFITTSADGATDIRTWYPPKDELRLLEALGPIDLADKHITITVPNGAIQGVRDVLVNLGLRERNSTHG